MDINEWDVQQEFQRYSASLTDSDGTVAVGMPRANHDLSSCLSMAGSALKRAMRRGPSDSPKKELNTLVAELFGKPGVVLYTVHELGQSTFYSIVKLQISTVEFPIMGLYFGSDCSCQGEICSTKKEAERDAALAMLESLAEDPEGDEDEDEDEDELLLEDMTAASNSQLTGWDDDEYLAVPPVRLSSLLQAVLDSGDGRRSWDLTTVKLDADRSMDGLRVAQAAVRGDLKEALLEACCEQRDRAMAACVKQLAGAVKKVWQRVHDVGRCVGSMKVHLEAADSCLGERVVFRNGSEAGGLSGFKVALQHWKDGACDFPAQHLYNVADSFIAAREVEMKRLDDLASQMKDYLMKLELHGDPKVLKQTIHALKEAQQREKDTHRLCKKTKAALEDAMEDGEADVLLPGQSVSVPMARAEEIASKFRQEAGEASRHVSRCLMFMAELEPWFPEVVLKLQEALPCDLVPVWQGQRARDSFESFELVSKSRNCVYKLVDGDRTYAAKQYQICAEGAETASSGLAAVLHEAVILKRMAHPHIINLCGVFRETGQDNYYYLMMPFCEHGSLTKWISTCCPTAWSLGEALVGVLEALVHLHEHAVVHGDCKPDNILIGGDHRSFLADFDVAVDGAARTTVGYQLQRATQCVAYTQGFDAPELRCSGSSKMTDMFAFGRTIHLAHHILAETAGCVPVTLCEGKDKADLVAQLLETEPSVRCTALAACRSKYFCTVYLRQQEEQCFCIISREACRLGEGIKCSQDHFISAECMNGYVSAEATAEFGRRLQQDGRIVCPQPGCASVFGDADLARIVHRDVFELYLNGRLELIEARLHEEKERAVKEGVAKELYRLQQTDKQLCRVLDAKKYVEEEILLLKCPLCRAAFNDFDGCFALSCRMCPSRFCGWCLVDCGVDAHAHVRLPCAEMPAQHRRDPLFQSQVDFNLHHGRRRGKRLQAFLQQSLDDDTRRGVLLELAPQLKGLVPDDLLQELMRQSDVA